MTEFSGLVAIVTGGASGIGAATVTLLRARGATAVSLDISGGDVMCDVSDTAQVAAAVAEVIARHGALDIVVNNAGSVHPELSKTPISTSGGAFSRSTFSERCGCRTRRSPG